MAAVASEVPPDPPAEISPPTSRRVSMKWAKATAICDTAEPRSSVNTARSPRDGAGPPRAGAPWPATAGPRWRGRPSRCAGRASPGSRARRAARGPWCRRFRRHRPARRSVVDTGNSSTLPSAADAERAAELPLKEGSASPLSPRPSISASRGPTAGRSTASRSTTGRSTRGAWRIGGVPAGEAALPRAHRPGRGSPGPTHRRRHGGWCRRAARARALARRPAPLSSSASSPARTPSSWCCSSRLAASSAADIIRAMRPLTITPDRVGDIDGDAEVLLDQQHRDFAFAGQASSASRPPGRR